MTKSSRVLLVVLLVLSISAVSSAAPALNYPVPGTQKTNIYVQNIGSSLANFTIQFTRQTGNTDWLCHLQLFLHGGPDFVQELHHQQFDNRLRLGRLGCRFV